MVKFLVHVFRVLRFTHTLAVYCKSTNLTFTKINFKNALNMCKGFFQPIQSTYISVPMVLTYLEKKVRKLLCNQQEGSESFRKQMTSNCWRRKKIKIE